MTDDLKTPPITLLFTFSSYDSKRLSSVSVTRFYGATKPLVLRVYALEDTDRSQIGFFDSITTLLAANPGYRIAGWDSRMSFLVHFLRPCMKYGIPFPWWYQHRFGPNYRFGSENHLDYKDMFTGYGLKSASEKDFLAYFGYVDIPERPVLRHLLHSHIFLAMDTVAGTLDKGLFQKLRDQLHTLTRKCIESGPSSDTVDALGVSLMLPTYDEVAFDYQAFLDVLGTGS